MCGTRRHPFARKLSGGQRTASPTGAVVTACGCPRPQKYARVNATISKLSQHRCYGTPKKTLNQFRSPVGTAAKMAALRSGPAGDRPGRRPPAAQDGRAPEHKKASRNDSHHSAASLMQRRNGAEQGRARPVCAGRAAIHSPGNRPAGRGLPVLPGQLSQRAPLRGAV